MSDIEFWIWLQRTLGAGARLYDILGYFGTPRELYEAGRDEWRKCGIINDKALEKLARYSPSESYVIMKNCEDNGWRAISPQSDEYPDKLRRLYNYPAVLYVDGDLSCVNNHICVAMVGTRQPTKYGASTASTLASEVAQAGAVIVSGGAIGIDSTVHTACMDAGQKTVLVMGCGFGSSYLAKNEELRQRVSKNGAVISEYPPFVSPTGSSFVLRNRLISGISDGVVVIEAGEKSGSLNTAAHAIKQKKDLFAVPGDLISSSFRGGNDLVKKGATSVFSSKDIIGVYSEYLKIREGAGKSIAVEPFQGIDEFPFGKSEKPERKSRRKRKADEVSVPVDAEIPNKPKKEIVLDNLSQNAIIVYNIMVNDEQICAPDEIVQLSGLNVPQVMSALTELELEGAVYAEGTNCYKIT